MSLYVSPRASAGEPTWARRGGAAAGGQPREVPVDLSAAYSGVCGAPIETIAAFVLYNSAGLDATAAGSWGHGGSFQGTLQAARPVDAPDASATGYDNWSKWCTRGS